MIDDRELLRRYREEQSQEAFAELEAIVQGNQFAYKMKQRVATLTEGTPRR